MGVLAWIVGIVLMAMFSMSAMVKITGHKMAVEARGRLGFSKRSYELIGVAEGAGVVGLLVGLVRDGKSFEWAGPAAAVGLIVTMIGAIYFHSKAHDEPKESVPAAMMIALSVLYLIAIAAR